VEKCRLRSAEFPVALLQSQNRTAERVAATRKLCGWVRLSKI
jgi:hypothetical protein